MLRTQYLDEDLSYIDIMQGKLKNCNLILSSNNEEIVYDCENCSNMFLKMGISFNFAISMRNSTIKSEIKVIELFESIYKGKIPICCSAPEYECNIKKLGIIIDWYKYKKREKQTKRLIKEKNSN